LFYSAYYHLTGRDNFMWVDIAAMDTNGLDNDGQILPDLS